MSRDYVTEMRAVIDAEATGTYVPGTVAAHIVAKLRETDKDLLTGWLDAQAETFIRQAINNRDNSQRTAIWTSGEQQGIGASRSQGYGRYEVTRWEKQ